jgi:hypothetical protein
MRSVARSPLWPWLKVVALLVALDWALFGAGLFFRWVPAIHRYPITWALVYRCVQELHAPPPAPHAYAIGSSIVFLGLDERRVRTSLAERQVPTAFETLTVFGAVGIDQALLAHAAIRTHPWLVVLTASVRDFPAQAPLDTPTSRVFLDSTVTFPPVQPTDVEGRLAGVVRAHWMLYRHRFFVRTALDEATTPLVERIAPKLATPIPPPGPLQPPSASGAPVPEEAGEWFFPGRLTAESWAAWTHWRETRRFADYQEFLTQNKSGAIEQYGRQTFATHGPERNVQLDAIAWSAGELRTAGIRTVVLAFPENPVLDDPDARALYDTALSNAVAQRLDADARANGARFVDLRHFLDAEDFYDLIHPNLSGSRKLSERLGAIVAEEWAAAGR